MDNSYLIDGRYGIGDIVDLCQLRRIFERFSEATGFTVGFLGHPGMNILIAAGWRGICTGFHRGCPAAETVCLKSNRHLLDHLEEPGKVVIEPCGHGLVDCATPIVVKGKHIASLATGQLFLKEPDLEWFKRRARLFGFDEDAYLKAVKEIPVVSEERLRSVTALLGEIALILSRQGYMNLITKAETERLVLEITERKRAEEALRESKELFSSFMRHSPVYTFIKEVTPTESRVLQASDNYAQMIGIPGPQMIGRTMEELFPPEFAAKITADDWAVVSSGNVLQLDEDLNGRNYTTIKFPIILRGRNLLAGYTIDITDRRRAEEERRILEERLQHADKMEAVGTLAGGIAHDFNNLLMGIEGYASLTLLELDPAHPHYERLKRIEEQVQSGADLTRQLLGFARGGRYEVKPADINEILEKSSAMFGRTKKEITIHRKLGKDLRTVEVDRGQMEQVFMNLYVNAWQAMPGGGEIYLETENVFLEDGEALPHFVAPGAYVKISVTDTGTGMDEKTRARIFDPFFTTKGMGRGTGLGLATVYGIVKGHRGMIHVESEPGRGTTFSIYLPASEKDVAKEKTEEGSIARGAETVLLADDEKMVLEVSREMLEFLGYRVYAVGSGQEAVAVYLEKQNEIDLVILDMIMPGISGGETFDRLRRIDPGVKVLLSSGYSLNGEAKTIMDRGCNGFIQKPFQMERLSRKIREMLENHAANKGRDDAMS